MRTPILAFTLFLLVLAGLLVGAGILWEGQPPSDQELTANYAKAWDFFQGMKETGGLAWWTGQFLQGTSLAPAWGHFLTNLILFLGGLIAGPYLGAKLAALFCTGLGGIGMYFFVTRLVKCSWSGCIGGLAYIIFPPLLVRLFGYEHAVVVCAMGFLPWSFWGILRFANRPSFQSALLAGLLFCLVLLSYAKIALLCVPALAGFAAALYFRQTGTQRPNWQAIGLVALTILLLGVLPNLPGLNETKHLAMFEFGPFQGWQQTFASKSAISWFDRDGLVGNTMGPTFSPTTAQGGNYPGLLLLGGLIALFFFRRNWLQSSGEGFWLRLFIGLALLQYWFSFGPRSVLGGHLEFLSLAANAPHWTIACAWFLLIVQAWILFQLLPQTMPGRNTIGSALVAVYFLVPGFRIIELLPGFSNLRAPHDFFQVPGAFCLAVAGALAVKYWLTAVKKPALIGLAAGAALLFALADTYPYWTPAVKSSLGKETFADFEEAQKHLKTSDKTGWVYPLSGRYFYLLTPLLSGRPLASEAFNSYLQQRTMALLQGTAMLSEEMLAGYLKAAGVSHVLIDKNDPDTKPELQRRFTELMPTVFENKNFRILEAAEPGFSYLAGDFVVVAEESRHLAPASLALAPFNVATIETLGMAKNTPGFFGRITGNGIEFEPGKEGQQGQAFVPAAFAQSPTGHYGRFAIESPDKPGWLIITEAYHPNWQAKANGQQIEIHRAFVGMMAVYTQPNTTVEMLFQPPSWYSFAIAAALALWGLTILLLLTLRFAKSSAAFTQFWMRSRHRLRCNPPPEEFPLIQAPLVVVDILPEILSQIDFKAMEQWCPQAQFFLLNSGILTNGAPIDQASEAFMFHHQPEIPLPELLAIAREKKCDALLALGGSPETWADAISGALAGLNSGHAVAVGAHHRLIEKDAPHTSQMAELSTWGLRLMQSIAGTPFGDIPGSCRAFRLSTIADLGESFSHGQSLLADNDLMLELWAKGASVCEFSVRPGSVENADVPASAVSWPQAWKLFLRSFKKVNL